MINIDPWQKEVSEYEGDLLLCTGRRVGKTYILAKKAIDLMAKKAGTPIVMISLTEDQAMIIMSMALNYAKERYHGLIGKGRDKPTMRSLTLNKGKMIIRPVGNTGDGARGFEGGVLIVDEASRMPKMFWMASKPILLTTNGHIWMGSTPFGMEGYFWDRYNEAVNKKDPSARFKVFSISTEEAINQREISSSWTEVQRNGALRILELDKKEMSWREYAQEYGGKFVQDLCQYFPDELLAGCCVLRRPETITQGDMYLGVDIARMGEDESVFSVIDRKDRDNLIQVENIITRKTLTTQTEQKIIELNKLYNFRKIYIDAGAGTLGVSVWDHLLEDNSVKNKIVAINNRDRALNREESKKGKILKEDLYNNLLYLMNSGKVKLLDDADIFQSLKSVQYEYVTSEKQSTRMRIFGNYTHCAESLIRSCFCSRDKSLNIWCR